MPANTKPVATIVLMAIPGSPASLTVSGSTQLGNTTASTTVIAKARNAQNALRTPKTMSAPSTAKIPYRITIPEAASPP